MLRSQIVLAATAALVLLAAGEAQATPCRNAAGKFIACPSAPAPSGQRCRAASGAFAKCSAPGAKPATASTKPTKTASAAMSKPKTH